MKKNLAIRKLAALFDTLIMYVCTLRKRRLLEGIICLIEDHLLKRIKKLD